MTVANFETIKEQFLLDIQTVVEMEDAPMELGTKQDCPMVDMDNGTEGVKRSH